MSSRVVLPLSRLALLASVALVAVPANAQTVTLDTVVVDGSRGGGTGPVTGYVAPSTTTGAKSNTPVVEIPQAVSVITTDQLEDRGVQNLGEALRYTAGVVSQPFGNDPRYFAPIIRGFDSTYSIYLNNFRFSRDFGALSFEPYGQERIEVIKGPASVLYGQDEPGGIVNLVQKRPTFSNFGEAGVEIGSHDRYVAKTDLGGVTTDGMASWRLTALGRLADDRMDFVGDDRFYVAPTITIAPDADTSLTILSTIQYDEGTSPIGLPQAGTLDVNPNGRIPRSRYAGEPDFNDNESLLGTVDYEFRHRFDERFEFRQNLQYVNFDADFRNLYFFGLGADDRTVTRGFSVQSEEYEGFGVDNQLETVFSTGAIEHTTLLGVDYRNNSQWRSSNFTGGFPTLDIFNPVYGNFTYAPSAPSISDTRLEQVGLYAQDQARIGGLTATLGLRQDFAENKDALTGATRDYDEMTGRVGAVYLFDNGIAPYVSYSTSFNPTAGANNAEQLLEPTEGEVVEGGVKYQPAGIDALVTASVFEITKTNVVSREFTSAGTVVTQLGEVRSRGFELEATASLLDGLNILGAYTYADTEVTENVVSSLVGNELTNTPRHAASLWLDYELGALPLGSRFAWLDGVSLGGGVRYLGKRFGNETNTIELPDATLFDAAIRYETGNLEAALNIDNIADDDYVASCNFGCFYGEGRKVLGSLTYKW